SDDVFRILDEVTRPTFVLEVQEIQECTYDYWDYDDSLDSGAPSAGNESGVNVVAKEQVGPYETVTLQAGSESELLTWLQDHGFNLPSSLDKALAPYVADQSYFVAMRLANDKTAGDIQPIV